MLEVSRSIIYTRGWGVSRWLSGIEIYLFPSVMAAEGREPWLGGSHWVPCLIDTLGGEKGHEKERNEIRTGQGWSYRCGVLGPRQSKGPISVSLHTCGPASEFPCSDNKSRFL